MMSQAYDDLRSLADTITRYLGVSCEVEVAKPEDQKDPATLTLRTEQDANLLIGKSGQNLRALEHVLRIIWTRRHPSESSLVVDVNDYRRLRSEEVATQAHTIARRVRDTQRSEALEPMNAYERRIVHTELATYHDIATESVGQDPHRRIVVKPA